MKIHEARPKAGSRRGRKRVGRGNASGHGKTSGRGEKGAKSRSGYSRRASFEGGQMPLVRRVPKRGFSNPFRRQWSEVNVAQLDRFNAGTVVDPDTLRQSGLVSSANHPVVILGRGELSVALTIRAHRFSRTAINKIEAAGGSAEALA